jgi:hypothetical protein
MPSSSQIPVQRGGWATPAGPARSYNLLFIEEIFMQRFKAYALATRAPLVFVAALAILLAPLILTFGRDIAHAATKLSCASKYGACSDKCAVKAGGTVRPDGVSYDGANPTQWENCLKRTCLPQRGTCEKNAGGSGPKPISTSQGGGTLRPLTGGGLLDPNLTLSPQGTPGATGTPSRPAAPSGPSLR